MRIVNMSFDIVGTYLCKVNYFDEIKGESAEECLIFYCKKYADVISIVEEYFEDLLLSVEIIWYEEELPVISKEEYNRLLEKKNG